MLAIATLGAVALIAGILWIKYTFQDYIFHPGAGFGRDTSLRTKGGIKGDYLEVRWPERKINNGVQPAIALRIPREYLHEGTTRVDKGGQITSIAIQFELPGPTPWQARPWLTGKEGTPEYENFKKTWLGKFSMDIRPGYRAYDSRMHRRLSAVNSTRYLRDTDIAGLERYSTKRCYTQEQLKNHAMKKYLDEKPGDDPSPSNCRLDRLWAELVSPPDVKKDDEGVAIMCMSTTCWVYFSVSATYMSMAIRHNEIPRWKEFVEPARQLVRSFIVAPSLDIQSAPHSR